MMTFVHDTLKEILKNPSRQKALERNIAFAPKMGTHYAKNRNYDHTFANIKEEDATNVSYLSPFIRYRLIHEKEVCANALSHHSLSQAEKFIQEIFWRSYWKGWLEARPHIWHDYCHRLKVEKEELEQNKTQFKIYQKALQAQTGIECFDLWVNQLIHHGYLHNHARMWFASIWIYTLKLPWQLGAKFFIENLLDGDPASNTLSWRWVCGLHTKGKTYLARADNIRKYTNGRFNPKNLALEAQNFYEKDQTKPTHKLFQEKNMPDNETFCLLLHEEYLCPEHLILNQAKLKRIYILNEAAQSQTHKRAQHVTNFIKSSLKDTAQRCKKLFDQPIIETDYTNLKKNIQKNDDHKNNNLMTPYLPDGFAKAAIMKTFKDIPIQLYKKTDIWDTQSWPHATKGFFPFKKNIPSILKAQKLTPQKIDSTE